MPEKMMTLSKIALEPGMHWVEKVVPEIKEDEVLIKVLATSVCGTDLHIYEWDSWAQSRVLEPHTMGHEFVGEVVKLGSEVENLKIGDLVSAETHIVCGHCEFCLNDQAHICSNALVIGVDRDGCFAEYIAIPARNAWLNDPKIPLPFLSIQEPLGNAVHTVLAGEIEGKSVAIAGVGPVGILAVDVVKACGAKQIFAIDVNDYRLNLAHDIGADVTINAAKEDVLEIIQKHTDHAGVDVVLEMSGSGSALNLALSYLKPGGRLSILGIPTKPVQIDVGRDIVFKGITIQGITGRRIFKTWYQVKDLVESGKLHLDQVVTHIMPWEDYEEAMKLMESGDCGKIVLTIHPKEN